MVRVRDRIPRAPLVTRLLAALTILLAATSVVSFLVESDLSRQALREHAERDHQVATEQARSVFLDDMEPVVAELQFFAEQFPIDLGGIDSSERAALANALDNVHRRRDFTVLGILSRNGDTVLTPIGPRLEMPPEEAFGTAGVSYAGRVVPTTDGGLAYVAVERLGVAPDDLLVVLGYRFDGAYARRLRDIAGGNDVVLAADGEVVATSVPDADPDDLLPTERDDQNHRLVTAGDRTWWARYHQIPPPDDGWGTRAEFGVLVEEPLAALDTQLLQYRLWAGAALLVLLVLLAWLVSRRMTRPLRELTSTASRISRGELDTPFEVSSNDEIGVLASTLERMRRGLRRQLELIRRQAEALQDAAGRIVGAQDEERRRLAGDLHDGVQRQLVMLRLHLGFGRERIRSDPSATEDVLDDLAGEIDRVLSRLRETAQGIYPAILRDRGLQGALFSMASRSDLAVDVRFVPDPMPRLPTEVEANTYFLVSEAVTNAVKHADANRIDILLCAGDDELEVVVRDDGVGFDPTSVVPGRGLGTMEDRARALGGEVTVDGTSGGTVVRAVLPVVSVGGALEVEEDRRHAPVDVDVLTEPELLEDRVDVLLDRPLRDVERPGHAAVAPPGGHQRQDVEFPGRQSREP